MIDQPQVPPESSVASSSGWWAIYTHHQHEKIVADMMSAKGLEVFLPLYETVRRWKDRNKRLTLPLFPCYLFVRESAGRHVAAASTPGVHMILTKGSGLAVIPHSEIEAIQRATSDPARIEPHPFFKCGERVRVIRGPMEGVEGILVRKKNLYRLVVSVEMISQAVAIEVDASDVASTTARAGPASCSLAALQDPWSLQRPGAGVPAWSAANAR